MREISEKVYRRIFNTRHVGSGTSGKKSRAISKNEKALEYALDIRKFEIELYWKRATYFWTLIASAFAAFFIVESEGSEGSDFYALILACIGLLLSLAWLLVNKGSKQWQENWENHVYLLEDGVIGPLYKTKIGRAARDGLFERLVTGPAPYSVSKLNQITSLFIIIIWIFLIVDLMYPDVWASCGVDKKWVAVIIMLFFIVLMLRFGASWDGDHKLRATVRKVKLP